MFLMMFVSVVLDIKFRTSHMLGKGSYTELHSSPQSINLKLNVILSSVMKSCTVLLFGPGL